MSNKRKHFSKKRTNNNPAMRNIVNRYNEYAAFDIKKLIIRNENNIIQFYMTLSYIMQYNYDVWQRSILFQVFIAGNMAVIYLTMNSTTSK